MVKGMQLQNTRVEPSRLLEIAQDHHTLGQPLHQNNKMEWLYSYGEVRLLSRICPYPAPCSGHTFRIFDSQPVIPLRLSIDRQQIGPVTRKLRVAHNPYRFRTTLDEMVEDRGCYLLLSPLIHFLQDLRRSPAQPCAPDQRDALLEGPNQQRTPVVLQNLLAASPF